MTKLLPVCIFAISAGAVCGISLGLYFANRLTTVIVADRNGEW